MEPQTWLYFFCRLWHCLKETRLCHVVVANHKSFGFFSVVSVLQVQEMLILFPKLPEVGSHMRLQKNDLFPVASREVKTQSDYP